MAHPTDRPRDEELADGGVGAGRVEHREVVGREPGSLRGSEHRPEAARPSTPTTTARLAAQRDRFGGFKVGAAFFGWLVATGLAALLAGVLTAGGAALALTNTVGTGTAKSNAATIGIGGGILLVAVLLVAYYAGGYVAGRLARFDGARQGLGVWLIGVIVAVAFAVAGWLFGSDYNVLNRLNLPNIPLDQGSVTTGGTIALVAIAVGTLVAAVLGGKLGERYHRRIDRFSPASADEPYAHPRGSVASP